MGIPDSERTRKSRLTRTDAGGRRVDVLLSPESNDNFAVLQASLPDCENSKYVTKRVIEAALELAVQRLKT